MVFLPHKALVPGLASGVLSVVIQLFLYGLGANWYFSIWALLPTLAMLVFSFATIWRLKAVQGGLIGFQQALFATFTVMVVHALFSVAGEWMVYNIIDPNFHLSAAEVKMKRILESMETYSRWIDYSDGDKDEIIQTAQKADYQFYFKNALSKFLLASIIYFLFALILASILKKEPRP
ncbi:MAG: DUF4199 domain-containing protein [Bacteroidetes bacterium]|nr:DUF4199 domain-containing protein [Bacteroidota bacterium]